MSYVLIAVQYAAQNIAFFCCALFAGAAVYANLVELPSRRLSGSDLLEDTAHASATRAQGLLLPLAGIGGASGLAAGITGLGHGWILGSALLLATIPAKMAETRHLVRAATDPDGAAPAADAAAAGRTLDRLSAASCFASLFALSIFILDS